jgi:hypothetical protein
MKRRKKTQNENNFMLHSEQMKEAEREERSVKNLKFNSESRTLVKNEHNKIETI